jgi:hypothetical protein
VRRSAAAAVLLWAAFNTALVTLLAAMGETLGPVLIYIAAVLITVLVAVTVRFGRRPAAQRRWREPSGAGGVILLACAALSAGLALAFGWWLLPVTGVLAALAVISEIAGRHASPG